MRIHEMEDPKLNNNSAPPHIRPTIWPEEVTVDLSDDINFCRRLTLSHPILCPWPNGQPDERQ